MWNERYSTPEYLYGTEPNSFLVDHAHLLASPVLSLAEGEGRNAVFLARLGLDVLGVDSSDVALAKAHALALAKGVSLQTACADLETYHPPERHFQSVVSIFAHLPGRFRPSVYERVEKSLKPGGVIVFEAYSENQLHYKTGGPDDRDKLMTVEKVRREFRSCEILLLHETERDVIEGTWHTGRASVIQFVGRKLA